MIVVALTFFDWITFRSEPAFYGLDTRELAAIPLEVQSFVQQSHGPQRTATATAWGSRFTFAGVKIPNPLVIVWAVLVATLAWLDAFRVKRLKVWHWAIAFSLPLLHAGGLIVMCLLSDLGDAHLGLWLTYLAFLVVGLVCIYDTAVAGRNGPTSASSA
ncbi:MAG: hypothetical protein AAF743_06435 [Planctomycetota bacterium]